MSEFSLRAEVPGTLISDYLEHHPEDPSELILLLHGFKQSGAHLFRKLVDACPESAWVLAPNAPYPLPERLPDGRFRVGFSWYFYDPSIDDYYIDMRVALGFLEGLVRRLGADRLPKRIIGFSQGGYLAPFAAARLGGVTQAIGIASEVLVEELRAPGQAWPPPFRLDAVHGERDEVVRFEPSRLAHEAALAGGVQGRFVGLPEVGHRISPEVVEAVKSLIRS